jgi:CRP-like cAMP-binding protein
VASVENHLIERLPQRDRRLLLDVCEPFELLTSAVLSEPGESTRHLYFPITGFLSLVAPIEGHAGLEVGMVGREGMLGAHLALGVAEAPWRAQVQGPGNAWRLSAAEFQRMHTRSPALRSALNRYLYMRMAQLAASAACLHFHLIGPRLARWLLATQDCAQAGTFRVTHEFLAYMLGVRRVGITVAAGALQRAGLIEYHRGEMTVLNREGLEAAACGCYASDRRAYLALMR